MDSNTLAVVIIIFLTVTLCIFAHFPADCSMSEQRVAPEEDEKDTNSRNLVVHKAAPPMPSSPHCGDIESNFAVATRSLEVQACAQPALNVLVVVHSCADEGKLEGNPCKDTRGITIRDISG
jgi:hypothetical protein